MKRCILAAGVGASLLILGACDGSKPRVPAAPKAESGDTRDVGGTYSTTPSVSFTSLPSNIGPPARVTANVRVTGVTLSPETVGEPARVGEGHLHFSLNGGKYDYPEYSGANGRLAVKLGVQGKYSLALRPTITYKNLPPGKYTLVVQIANNDHSLTGTSDRTQFAIARGR